MPWKPPPKVVCHRSGKTIYPADPQIKCGGMIFLKAYFTCAKTGCKLNEGNAVAKDGDVYHKNHVPKDKHTETGLDGPEMLRLKQQSMRQSHVAYKAAFEAEKGKYEQTGEVDLQTQNLMQSQNQASHTAYKQETEVEDTGHHAAAPPPQPVVQQEPEPVEEEQQQQEEYTQEEQQQEEYQEEQQVEEQQVEEQQEEEQPQEEAQAGGDGVRYVAQYEYTAADSDEVSFDEGDIIINANVVDEGWMTGTVERTGESGMLPSNYVEPE